MAIDEKFSWLKFFDFGPVALATVAGIAVKVVIIALVIFGVVTVKNILFPPPPSNMTNPEFKVAKGGVVHYEVKQYSEKKRQWWMPTPFVEIFGEMKSDRDAPAVGARAGARWEF